VRRFARENGLSLFFLAIFVFTLLGQSFAGRAVFNEERREHGESPISWAHYLVSPEFGAAVMENWQSEFLQFSLFILATIWLVQRGSNESKVPGEEGIESKQKQRLEGYAPDRAPAWAKVRGVRSWLYQNSLLVTMMLIFIGTWTAQSLTNWANYNAEQEAHDAQPVTWWEFVRGPDFWEKTLQNWQSEFLAVGAMAVFTIYLRQRGSPESKPVGAPHDETASSG